MKLTCDDEQDLIDVIKKLLPAVPEFSILFESQLRNATCTDPKLRWDPRILSLCLNYRAKYILTLVFISFAFTLADLGGARPALRVPILSF